MKKIKYCLLFVFIVFTAIVISGCDQEDSYECCINVGSEMFSKKYMELKNDGQKPVMVDVRTPMEYETGHLIDAVNINYYDSEFQHQVLKLDNERPLFVYCRSGNRSSKTLGVFRDAGFKTIYHLEKGIIFQPDKLIWQE